MTRTPVSQASKRVVSMRSPFSQPRRALSCREAACHARHAAAVLRHEDAVVGVGIPVDVLGSFGPPP